MGGADSEVSKTTRQIVLESAWFKPQSVRATSKRLGLRTEASYRFERGADLTAAGRAMLRALELVESTGAGARRGDIVDCYPRPYEPRELLLDAAAIRRLLGMDVPAAETERILTSLGFGVRTLGGWQAGAPDAAATMGAAGESWQVTVPGWRVDIQRPVDLIEEVGRHFGFEHLPSAFPGVQQAPKPSDPRIARDTRVRRSMLGMGFSEAVTFGFIEETAAAPYLTGDAPVTLANPLSEKFTTLRPSLLPGLVDAVSHNRRHGRRDVRLFEIGTRFSPRGEGRSLAGAWTGLATPDHWSGWARPVDFFDIKGVAEQLCAALDVVPQVAAAAVPYLVEGRAASLRAGAAEIGVIGQLSPAIAEQRDLPAADPIYVLELSLDALTASAPAAATLARPLPRHPSVVRDVSILVDDALSAETVRGTIRSAGPATLAEVREFDRYQGKGIAEGKVSLSLRLTFQAPERTLTDAEVNLAMDQILAALKRDLNAVQR
jgi:phenylalanyl-tRNA synthetase beta chain